MDVVMNKKSKKSYQEQRTTSLYTMYKHIKRNIEQKKKNLEARVKLIKLPQQLVQVNLKPLYFQLFCVKLLFFSR